TLGGFTTARPLPPVMGPSTVVAPTESGSKVEVNVVVDVVGSVPAEASSPASGSDDDEQAAVTRTAASTTNSRTRLRRTARKPTSRGRRPRHVKMISPPAAIS